MTEFEGLTVKAIRCFLELLQTEKAKQTCLAAFFNDPRCNVERITKGIMFMYLTEYDSEYAKSLEKLLPSLVTKLLESWESPGSPGSASTSGKQIDGQNGDGSRLNPKFESWQMIVFALLKRSGIDEHIWNPDPFLIEGIQEIKTNKPKRNDREKDGNEENENYNNGNNDNDNEEEDDDDNESDLNDLLVKFSPDIIKRRREDIPPVLMPSPQIIQSRMQQLSLNRTETVRSIYRLAKLPFQNEELSKDVNLMKSSLVSQWTSAKRIHALFFRHTNITQPILFATMLYCSITTNDKSIKDSDQLKQENPALYELFYLVMSCAQISTDKMVTGLPKRGDREIYDKREDPLSVVDEEKQRDEKLKRIAKLKEAALAVPDDVLRMLYSGALSTQAKEGPVSSAIWIASDFPMHICGHRKYFTEFISLNGRALFEVEPKGANLGTETGKPAITSRSEFHRVEGVGKVEVAFLSQNTNQFVLLTLKNVRYVPSLQMNLLSYEQLKAQAKFDNDQISLSFPNDSCDPRFLNRTNGSATNSNTANSGSSTNSTTDLRIKSIIPGRYCFLDFKKPASDFKMQQAELASDNKVRHMADYREVIYYSEENLVTLASTAL